MSDLADRLYRSLAAAVAKLELDVMATQAIHDTRYPGAPIPCSCDAISSGPGCKPCLVRRGRAAMAEYEAAQAETILRCACGLAREDHDDPDSFEPVPCSTCGKVDPDITIQFALDGTRTAQCRACYVAAREEAMAVGG